MADTDGLYTIKLRGEKHTYEFRGTEQHGISVVSEMLSDLTGYKSSYISSDEKLGHMKISEEREVNPADRGNWPGVPTFIITRVA